MLIFLYNILEILILQNKLERWCIFLNGAVDRLENDKAIIVMDNRKIVVTPNKYNLKEGDRISLINGTIKKIDNKLEKEEMINLQNKIFKKR